MSFHIAQINIGKFRMPKDDPVNADFINALARVNTRAEGHDGFVWRLTGDGDDAMDLNPFDDPNMAINMSVWRNLDTLMGFVYRDPDHRAFMRRRSEWFEALDVYMCLWWIPADHVPSIAEGINRLESLRVHGPTAHAFTFKDSFPQPEARAEDCV